MNRIPLGLIGMIGLVLAVEHGLAAHYQEFTASTTRLAWQTTGRAAVTKEVRQSQILCFGDSLVNQGIYPRVLEATLGRPSYNLAVPAGTPATSYFLLRRALNAGARPGAVIVDFHAMILPTRPDVNAELLPRVLTTRELADLSWVARDPRLFTVTASANALTSVKDRHAIRDRVREVLQGKESPWTLLYPALVRNQRVNRGVLVQPPVRSPAAKVEPAPVRPSGGAAWFAYPANVVFVRRFLDLAAAKGISVFWLLPPISPAEQDRFERKGIDAGYTAFVAEMQAHYSNIVVIDGRHAGYGPEVFADQVHLNRHGASTFTLAVASRIGPYLADNGFAHAPRRLDLPSFRLESKEIVPLEDVAQSILATQAIVERLRR